MPTSLSALGLPRTAQATILPKTQANYPSVGLLVEEFDLWHEGYADAVVNVYYANTTTLLPCYADVGLTERISNPIVLISRTDTNDVSYGRFPSHVYVPFGYELEIQGEHQTGKHLPPIISLAGKDVSDSVVTAADGTIPRKLKDRFSDAMYVSDYGELGFSAATNTATIIAALSRVAANGGGRVLLPNGSFPILTLSIPEKCTLAGRGQLVTTLYTEVSGNVITLAGNDCGLEGLTIDGLSLKSGSVGVTATSKDNIIFTDVMVKRFDTGILMKGGSYHDYTNLHVDDCNKGYRGIGDLNISSSPAGSAFIGMGWKGGAVTSCIESGLELLLRDAAVRTIQIEQVRLTDHVGDGALILSGVRGFAGWELVFERNLVNIKVEDNLDASLTISRTTSNISLSGGYINGGKSVFDGVCDNISIEQATLTDTEFEMNIPDNQVLLRDCIESGTAFTGESSKVSRFKTVNYGSIKGETSDGTAVVVYQTRLAPNEVVFCDVTATAEQRNGLGFAAWKKHHSAKGGVATLKYDGVVVAFAVGKEIVGQTTGARAIIIADASSTLSLAAVAGEFENNELIKEADGAGEARVNGVLTYGAAALISTEVVPYTKGSNTGSPPSGWNVSYQVSGEELQVFVVGAASTDIAWNVCVGLTVL
jgi:hypothetical protein